MGLALAASHQAAKHVFDEVNDALNENLFEIMANGPDDLIRMTRNAQPALFATSMAAARLLGQTAAAVRQKCSLCRAFTW